MRIVRVEQRLGVHQQMAILGQYSENGIVVMISDHSGEGRGIGTLIQLVPMNDGFKATIKYKAGVKPLKPNQLTGFVFSNFYGKYFLSKSMEV